MAVTDLLSEDEAAEALASVSIFSTERDKLRRTVTAVSQYLDTICGPIIERTIYKTFQLPAKILVLPGPVTTLVSVTENGNQVDLNLIDYTASAGTGYLRKTSMAPWKPPTQVIYSAGRVSSADEVPEKFKQAAVLLLRNWWRSELGDSEQVSEFTVPFHTFPHFTLPNAVRELLVGELYHLRGIA